MDLTDIDIGNGQSVTVVEEAKYLGSYAARAGNDLRDVEARIDKASKAFGALKHCLFKSKDVSIEAKRGVYNGLVLAILLFGAEHWCLTAKMVRMRWHTYAQCALKHSRAQDLRPDPRASIEPSREGACPWSYTARIAASASPS